MPELSPHCASLSLAGLPLASANLLEGFTIFVAFALFLFQSGWFYWLATHRVGVTRWMAIAWWLRVGSLLMAIGGVVLMWVGGEEYAKAGFNAMLGGGVNTFASVIHWIRVRFAVRRAERLRDTNRPSPAEDEDEEA